jgi:zinc/manganese transport system substrate-binding protein
VPLALAAALLVASLAVSGCGPGSVVGDGRVDVVATTTQVADIAQAVAGRSADVHVLLRPGSDPHTYEPRPADLEAIARADIVLSSGLGLDDWAREIVDAAGGDPEVVDVGARVPVRHRTTGGDLDPHWWHDPRNVAAASRAVERALTAAGAPPAAVGAAGLRFRSSLVSLDGRLERCFERIPVAERRLVTDHDALGYFAARYGLRVVGAVFPSQSTQAQASAGDVAALERLIGSEQVRAVFPDAGLNARLAERIAKDTGVRIGGRLYGDSLGPPGSGAATLEGMLSENARTIVRGITSGSGRCQVPR